MTMKKLKAYIELARIDKPIGIYLLAVWSLGGAYAPPNLSCYPQYRITKHNMNPYFL